MKVVLIRPPEINRVWVGIPRFFNEGIFLFPPLGIMQIKAYIERYTSHQVIVYDSLMHKADYTKTALFIKKISPQVVGISTFTHSLIDVIETAREIKRYNPSMHIIAGGPHTYNFSVESADLLKLGCIDYVILGDGEEAMAGILNALGEGSDFKGVKGVIYKDDKGKVVTEGGVSFVNDLDRLPFPARDIPRVKEYYTPASSGRTMTTIITSRGCPFNCKFCSVQRRYRTRSIENIVDEIESCSKAGFKEIFFIDDTFNVTKERVVRLAEEILKRDIKVKWGFKARCNKIDGEVLKIARRAGCFRIHYGVETGSLEGLESMDKNLTTDTVKSALEKTRMCGIRTTAYFMIGCPHERNKEDIFRTINFARDLAADYAVFSLMSPYPDTAFYKEGLEQKAIDGDGWKGFMKDPGPGYDLCTLWEEHFSREELVNFLKIAHRKFYYRPRVILRALTGIYSFTELKRILRGALSLLKLELLCQIKGRI